MLIARLLAATSAMLAACTAFAASPTAPEALRAEVYSSTAGELFWSRSIDADGVVIGYEISRDGQLIDTRDALSLFVDTLIEGQQAVFSVAAIDDAGERSPSATIRIVGGDRHDASGAGGVQPTPPANVRSEVYSSTAAEVFWDRELFQSLRYEIAVDGEIVSVTDGTSVFLSDLSSARGRLVDIVAIDAQGSRSGATSIRLGEDDGSTPSASPIAPTPPTDLRLEVYSSTAAELFWDRELSIGPVVETEIVRDGAAIGTTDGRSFFDATRVPGRHYRYELVSVRPDGIRSDPSIVDERMVDSTMGSSDSPLSAESLFALVAGQPLSRIRDVVEQPFVRGTPSLESIGDYSLLEIVRAPSGVPSRVRFACSGGGEYEKPAFQGLGQSRFLERRFSDCTIDGVTYDGGITRSQGTIEFDDYSLVTDEQRLFRMSGRVYANFGRGIPRSSTGLVFDRYEDSASATTVIDSQIVSSFDSSATPTDEWSIDLTVTAPWTDGRRLSGSTGERPFQNRLRTADSFGYERGVLTIANASNTTALSIDADVGDASTWLATITDNASTRSSIRDWVTLTDNCPDPVTILEIRFSLRICP